MMTLPQPGPLRRAMQDPAIRDRVDRIAQVAVLAADAVQVVAEMAILGKRLRVVGERAVFAADREIETRGGRQVRPERSRARVERLDRSRRAGAVPDRAENRGRRSARAEKDADEQHHPTQ